MPDDDKTKPKRLPLHESLAARMRQETDDGNPDAVTALILAVAEAQLKPEHREVILEAARYAWKAMAIQNINVRGAFEHLVKQYKNQDNEEAAAKLADEASADKAADTAPEDKVLNIEIALLLAAETLGPSTSTLSKVKESDEIVLKAIRDAIKDVEASRLISDPEIARLCQKLWATYCSTAETAPIEETAKPPFVGPDLTDTSGLSDAS